MGTLVLIIGIVLFYYPEITYQGKESIEVGPVVIARMKPKVVYVPKILSLSIAAIGLIILIVTALKA